MSLPQILNEEITPTLTKLKEERSTYLEYQKVQREHEHLTKLYIAFKYVLQTFVCSFSWLQQGRNRHSSSARFIQAEEKATKSKEDLEQVNQELENITEEVKGGWVILVVVLPNVYS